MPSVGALGSAFSREKELLPYTIHSEMTCNQCELSTRQKWANFLKQQPIYAQYMKLLVLFALALAHVFYIGDFLEVFRAFEDNAVNIETRYPNERPNSDARLVSYVFQLLIDYKKNLWMSVGAMCASLSTSCFFLLLINENSYHRVNMMVMRTIDILAFFSLPLLLFARSLVVSRILTLIDQSIRGGAKLVDPTEMMNKLKCSVGPRENLSLCSSIVERSIFPVVVLEYLIVLAIITAAYIGLAYLIVYCIRHWFPHDNAQRTRQISREKVYGPLVQA